MRLVLLLWLFWTGYLAMGADDNVFRVRPGFGSLLLARKAKYLQSERPLTAFPPSATVLKRFQPCPTAIPIFRNRASWYCIYFRLRNDSAIPIDTRLLIETNSIDSVQLSICDGRDCRSFPVESVIDPAKRIVGANLRHLYPLRLAPGHEFTLFFNLSNAISWQRLRLPVLLVETNHYSTLMFWRSLFEKVYVGTLFFVILFVVTLLAMFKERIYFYYALYLIGLGLFFVCREKYIAYFEPQAHFFIHFWLVQGFSYILMCIGYSGFAVVFLNARLYAPDWFYKMFANLRKFILLITPPFWAIVLFKRTDFLVLYTPVIMVVVVLMLLGIWALVGFAIRRRYPPAYLFCIGYAPVSLLALVIDPANEAGYLGQDMIQFFYATHIFEIVVLTLGLGLRFKSILTEKEQLLQTVSQQRQTQLETIIQTQEAERQRIATDLHDDLGGTLATLHRRLADLRPYLHESTSLQAFDALQPLTQKSTDDLRRIAHNLMPPEFARIGLRHALDQFISSQPAQPTHFVFIASGIEQKLPLAVELNAYRIVSELVHNVHKHAQSKRAAVQLLYKPDHLIITVEDDGLGNRTRLPSNEPIGIGLKNSNLRAEYIGATLWREASEAGTLVVLTIPYSASVHAVRTPKSNPPD